MQVFDLRSGEPYLIGRVDSAKFIQAYPDANIRYGDVNRVPRPMNLSLHVSNWMPLTLGEPSPTSQLVVRGNDTELKQIISVLAMLVERNGGAVHVDIADILNNRPLTIMQKTDPWGIVLTTEAP